MFLHRNILLNKNYLIYITYFILNWYQTKLYHRFGILLSSVTHSMPTQKSLKDI